MRPTTDDSLLHTLLHEATAALEEGQFEEAEATCRRALALDPKNAEVCLILGQAVREQDRLDEAEGAYRAAVLSRPDLADAWAGLAGVMCEQLRWDESRRAANRALREDPSHPEAAWIRGVLRERRGDNAGAQRDYLRAWRGDPQTFPLPVPLDDETVEQVVGECLVQLHPTLREYLANVPVILEELPSDEQLQHYDPPASPTGLLGYFSGSSLMERSLHDPWSNLPSAIVIFRRNLERFAHDHDQLVDELRVTLFHEVGHFLGLDEDDLEERGID